MLKSVLRSVLLASLMFPAVGMGAEPLLLEEDTLLKKIEKDQDYQLIDARNPESQQIAPLAFSTRYWINVRINKALVLIVADTDVEAMEIALSIPAATGRDVFAVKGGVEAWLRVAKKASSVTSGSRSFVIPKDTCEQGKPIQELKRDKPLRQ